MKNTAGGVDDLHRIIGDSRIIHFTFDGFLAKILIQLDEPDDTICVSAETDSLISRIHTDDLTGSLIGSISVLDLNETLKSENGFFVPPTSFVDLMKQTRIGVNLAYGRRGFSYVVNFSGYGLLLSLLLKDLSCISWQVKDSS